MSNRVADFEPITAEHAELVAGTDETKECGVCGGRTVRIGDARYFRWRGELRISEVWTCEDCRTSGNRLLCRETGRVVRLSHVHTGSGFETPDAGAELVADGGVDVSLNQLAGEYGVPVQARCVGCSRNDRDRVRVKLADPDLFPEDMANAGAESFKHVCHRCRKGTYWNVLEVIEDVVLERVDERDEHDRDVPEKVVRFLDENGDERGERSTSVRAGGKPLAVSTDGGDPQ